MPIYRRDLTVVPGKWTVTESKQHNVVDLTITNEYKARAPYAFTTQMAFKVTEGGPVFVNSVIIPAIEKNALHSSRPHGRFSRTLEGCRHVCYTRQP